MVSFLFGFGVLIIVFLWTFGSSLGFPGALVFLVAAGAMAGSISELLVIILVCFIAAVLGDFVAYTIARKASSKLSKLIKKLKLIKQSEEEAKKIIKKYGFLSIFLTRFLLMSLCAVVSYIAGFEKMKKKTFVLGSISGEILYASIFPLIGFLFRELWGDIVEIISDVSVALALGVIVIFLVVVLVRRRRKHL